MTIGLKILMHGPKLLNGTAFVHERHSVFRTVFDTLNDDFILQLPKVHHVTDQKFALNRLSRLTNAVAYTDAFGMLTNTLKMVAPARPGNNAGADGYERARTYLSLLNCCVNAV